MFDGAGNIYSTTDDGGNNSCSRGCGTVFKLTPSAGGQWTESILHFFTGGSDGSKPIGTMAIDGAGNLYGVSQKWLPRSLYKAQNRPCARSLPATRPSPWPSILPPPVAHSRSRCWHHPA